MIKLKENILNQIIKRAEQDYPYETCGLCSADEEDQDIINTIHPCENIQNDLHEKNPVLYTRTAKDAYTIDPEKWHSVSRNCEKDGKILRIVYHSHIDCGAYFSQEDQRMAAPLGEPSYPELVYFIVSVVNGRAAETAMYGWNFNEEKYGHVNFSIDS